MSSARIAIIGAGPAGLTLARLLKVQDIPFRLFELDESPASRPQGGSLDIHGESGQLALKAAGLFAEFEKYARRDGEALKMLDMDGTVVWADDGNKPEGSSIRPPDRPEIDRRDLRKILLESLDEGMIEWGKKVVDVSEDENSTSEKPQFTIELAGGQKESGFELVVGADGAWSRVRGLLTTEKPFYSGITGVEARIDDIDTKHPDLAERVGLGTCFQVGGLTRLACQRNGGGVVLAYANFKVDEDWATTCGIDWADVQASKQAVVDSKLPGWDPLSREFILRSDHPLIARPLYMLPLEATWKTRAGVTLVGDAAHVMTPFGGVGVNLALADALDLSEAIQSHFKDGVEWTTALQRFEEQMFARCQPQAKRTYRNLTVNFSGVGMKEIVRRMMEARQSAMATAPPAAAASE